MKKRVLSWLLALVMLVGLLPLSALAARMETDEVVEIPVLDQGETAAKGDEFPKNIQALENVTPGDNQASGITITGVTPTPAFAPNVYSYALPDQLYNKSSLSFRVTVAEGSSLSGTVNGTALTGTFKGNTNKSISLIAGSNTITITVTPPEGSASEPQTYTFTVRRAPGMTKLVLADGSGNSIPMNKAFSTTDTDGYTATLPVGAFLKFTPTLSHAASTELQAKQGEGEYTSLSADGYAIAAGDNVFKLKTVSKDGAMEGSEYTLTVSGRDTVNYTVSIPEGAALSLTDCNDHAVVLPEGAAENGQTVYALAGLMSGTSYTWRVGKYGFHAKGGTFTAENNGTLSVQLTEATEPTSDLKAQWSNFRNSEVNMAITTSDTPTSAKEATLKWVSEVSLKQGSGNSQNNPAPLLIVDNKLITTTGTELLQISLETGKILRRGNMVAGNGALGNAAPVYGGGMIFQPLGDGRVQAFDAVTLNSLWVSESLGTQCTTGLIYHQGYLYGSTGNTAPGRFFCIQVADEDSENSLETKYATWSILDPGKGSYWSTPYVTDDFVVYGTDQGILYSRNSRTGVLISELPLGSGKTQRTGMAYYNGRIYGGDHAGNLFSVAVAANGTLSDLKKVNYAPYSDGTKYLFNITSTPVICDGVIFFGGSKQLLAADANTLKLIATTGTTGFDQPQLGGVIQSSSLLKKGDDGKIYLYTTQNCKPSSLCVTVYDSAKKTLTASALYTPDDDKQEYSIVSPICDSEGTIYFRNDSGYLFAVKKGQPAAYCPVTFNVTPADATVVVKDSDGAPMTAASNHVYHVAAGSYSYTISKSGYVTATGSFTVTEDEAANQTPKTVEVTLTQTPTTPSNLSVSISVKDPQGATYLDKTSYSVASGTTVYELLLQTGLNIQTSNSDLGVYIQAIEGLAEFDEGPNSGWMYRIGKTFPNHSASAHRLKDGDYVEWLYTRDLGNDIGGGSGSSNSSSSSSSSEPKVTVTTGTDGKPVAKVELPRNATSAVATIPTADLGEGNVLVIVKADGTEEILKKSLVDGETASALLNGSATVKLVDNTKSFTDTAGHWAKDSIAFVTSHELFQGTAEGTFSPDASMNRAMLATVLYRLEDAKADGGNPFADVAADTWYTDAVTWASANQIVSGTGSGFAPDRDLSRQELVTMLYRYAKSVGMDTDKTTDLDGYADAAEVADWAAEAMAWAVKSGLIAGRGGAVLAPEGTATRAEVATILQRLVALMVK